MKVVLLAVGRVGAPLAGAVEEYERRTARYFRFEAVEVREGGGRGTDPERVRAEEGERLLARLPTGVQLVALDRVGDQWSSRELAAWLGAASLRGVPAVAFAIGGAFGLAEPVLRAAQVRWSLGKLTLPHELARLVVVEQLYRAGTITRGEPYHKERVP